VGADYPFRVSAIDESLLECRWEMRDSRGRENKRSQESRYESWKVCVRTIQERVSVGIKNDLLLS